MKFRSWLLCIVLAVVVCGQLSAAQKVALLGKRPDGTASANAIRVLEDALRREGLPARWIDSPRKQEADETLLSFDLSTPGVAESFAIRKSAGKGRPTISIAGGDDTGLAYGVFELLGRVAAAGHPLDLFQAAQETAR